MIISSCAPPEDKKQQVLEHITLNVCQTDSENADYWETTKINLFDKAGLVKVGELPPCSSIVLEVIEKQDIGGLEHYKVRYNSISGWQTKRLLVGEEKTDG